MPSDRSAERILLPDTFPQSDYTPFGYINNPYHSAVSNPSGVIRTVPPMGFGFWARMLPWPYGSVLTRPLSYLSLLHLSVYIDGVRFHTVTDFQAHDVRLVSQYHTQTLMSYDWEFDSITLSAKYFLADEHALVCVLELDNGADTDKTVTVHVTNIYGFPDHPYWGCDGVRSVYRANDDAGVSKFWAYGDIMIIGADHPSAAYKATASADQWHAWIGANDLSGNEGALVRFTEGPDHLYTMMSYRLAMPAGASDRLILCLARGVNEVVTLQEYFTALKGAIGEARRQLAADEDFYTTAPVLVGDWPEAWKHGWIYDLETIRTTMRPPVGIFKHHWDAMQVHNPRSVLGEMGLDTLCLSYADVELAKEVIYGTFADAPAPNVPCTREDGSMNMIGESGNECGTAPNWGFPFLTIWSIYLRDRDDHWIRNLYPYLKAYLEWWLIHRTDEEGWFHADCSWESGQDGSRRFLSNTEGASAWFVRTVDIEASVAHAMQTMITYARVAGLPQDVAYWQRLAEDRIVRTRSMYVDGWFRDVDARTNTPIILPDYYDVMMLSPATVGIATQDQIEGLKPKFQYFREHPRHWLEWPSFVMPFSEAAWNAGLREFLAEVLSEIGTRIYTRLDSRTVQPTGGYRDRYTPHSLPEPYHYRIPGVANEFWPLQVGEHSHAGAEHYGWGATFPTLVIRNIIGFREGDSLTEDRFFLAPALPVSVCQSGNTYGITNLQYRESRTDLRYTLKDNRTLLVSMISTLTAARSVTVMDETGRTVAQTTGPVRLSDLSFEAVNGAIYTVTLT